MKCMEKVGFRKRPLRLLLLLAPTVLVLAGPVQASEKRPQILNFGWSSNASTAVFILDPEAEPDTQLWAQIRHPARRSIDRVMVFGQGGYYLGTMRLEKNSSFWKWQLPVSLRDVPTFNALVTVVAIDKNGVMSRLAPYLDVPQSRDLEPKTGPTWADALLGTSVHGRDIYRPDVFQAGFYDTDLDSEHGGRVCFRADVWPSFIGMSLEELMEAFSDPTKFGDRLVSSVHLVAGRDRLPLRDDGQSCDGSAADMVYGAEFKDIPAGAVQPGIYGFEVEATSVGGAKSERWPYLTHYGPASAPAPGPTSKQRELLLKLLGPSKFGQLYGRRLLNKAAGGSGALHRLNLRERQWRRVLTGAGHERLVRLVKRAAPEAGDVRVTAPSSAIKDVSRIKPGQ